MSLSSPKFLLLLILLGAGHVFGSTFSELKKVELVKDSNLQHMAKKMHQQFSKGDSAVFFNNNGNAFAKLKIHSFDQSQDEKTLNVVKNYNIRILGLDKDDKDDIEEIKIVKDNKKTIEKTYEQLLVGFSYYEFNTKEQMIIKKFKNDLETSAMVMDQGIKFFVGSHSSDDGTWGTLVIIDSQNKQIVSLKIGFTGT